jgi:hypothetical protein
MTAPRGGEIITGKVENQSCEVLIDGDGIIRKGNVGAAGISNSAFATDPCRHLQALRESVRGRCVEAFRGKIGDLRVT